MPYTYRTRVRYAECDKQGVVFNANYMVYMDDASEVWASSLSPSGNYIDLGWDWMVVKSTIEWQGSAAHGETLTVEVGVVRYGSTSLDFGYVGTVEGRPVFTARSTFVSIAPGTSEKMATPENVKALLGAAQDWDVPG